MGKAARLLRALLGIKKSKSEPPQSNPPPPEKKRWGFSMTFKGREVPSAPPSDAPLPTRRRASYSGSSRPLAVVPLSSLRSPPPRALAPARGGEDKTMHVVVLKSPPPRTPPRGGEERSKHAMAVAAATAAAAAAKAAAAVVQLTSAGIAGVAAVKIQSAFRGYLARRALKALRGLVKLQALVRGNIVRKQAAETLRCMQALVRVQARARARRSLQLTAAGSRSTPSTPVNYDEPTIILSSTPPKSDIQRKDKMPPPPSGWSWLDRWMEERYWDGKEGSEKAFEGFGIDDDRSTTIVEMDPGRPRYNKNRRRIQYYSITSDPSSGTFATDRDSSKETTASQLSTHSSSINMARCLSPQGFRGMETAEYASLQKKEYSQNVFCDQPGHPNYMADTESSKAKVRSQSAPRQRLQFDNKSGSMKKIFAHQQVSSASPPKPSSIQYKFANKAFSGSGSFNRLGTPIRM